MSTSDSILKRRCVLLVEDEAIIYKYVRLVLAKVGLDVDIACNGVEALEATAMKDYALVLMDCRMPLMCGLETTRRIRSASSLALNRNIPIIAFTADVLDSNREACIEAGMNDWAAKPIGMVALTQIVQKWLPDHRPLASVSGGG